MEAAVGEAVEEQAMSGTFTVKNYTNGRRSWECKGKCCKNPKYTDGYWNNATRMECRNCGFEPNRTCRLWGDGKGVGGGKWKPDNGPRPPGPSAPSKQTAAGKAATDKRAAAAESKQVEKLRKEKEKAEQEIEALRQKVAKFETGKSPTSDEQPTLAPAPGPEFKAKLAELEKKEKQLKDPQRQRRRDTQQGVG